MRVLVFLLILANLLFLAWARGYLGSPGNADASRVSQQLLPDRLSIVARGEPPPLPPTSEPAPRVVEKPPTAAIGNAVANGTVDPGIGASASVVATANAGGRVCLLLSELPPAESEKFEAVLAERFPAFKAQRTALTATGSYWINIPPLAGKQEVDAKVAELKKLDISEYFVVQETGPNNRAISLGLYSRRAAAETRLEALREKGVRSARITERNVRAASVTLELDGPEAQADALRQAIDDNLPESKAAPCKTGTTSAQ